MHARIATWCGALVAALVAFGALAVPASAAHPATVRVTLEHQTPVVALRTHSEPLNLTIHTNATDARWRVVLFDPLTTRSALGQLINGHLPGALRRDATPWAPLRCVHDALAQLTVGVGEESGRAPRECGSQDPYLDAHCEGLGCDGVYPLAVIVSHGRRTTTVWSVVTLLANGVSRPVQVALIFNTNDAGAGQGRQSSDLGAIARAPDVPLTVSLDYRGVARAVVDDSPSVVRYRTNLARAVDPSDHRLMDAPPAGVDFAALAAHHLDADIVTQARTATTLATHFTDATTAVPVALSGSVSAGDLSALALEGVDDVVVPDGDFRQPPGQQLDWGTPFHVVGASSRTLVLSEDGPLHALLDDQRITPGLRCALAVGAVALLHFEAPDAVATRTVVVDANLSDLTPGLVSDLIDELAHDPVDRLATVASIFEPALVGANGYPTYRALRSFNAPAWSATNVAAARRVGTQLQSLNESVSSLDPVTPLQIELLLAERRLDATVRQHELSTVSVQLLGALDQFHIDDSTITLTANDSPLPITITSTAKFRFSGFLSLSGPGLTFPDGNLIPANVNGPTRALRVPVVVNGSKNLTLEVRLETENRQLIVASAAISVRGSGVSAVGYALTIVSLLVIALWWWRTLRRRPPARHAS